MASGAAASERTTCEMLARAGWRVRVVATTASESFQSIDHPILLREKGISYHRETLRRSGGNVLAFTYRGVNYRLLDTGAAELNEARRTRERDLDELIAEELATGPPAILLTYGSSEAEVRRRAHAREKGVRVVFSVRNFAYLHPRAFESVDAIISPSRFISDYYRQHLGVEVTPMPLPISIDDVVAPFNSPTFVTLINPSPQKGVLFFLRIVEQGLKRWPNLQFLTVESRGSGHTLLEAAAMLGLDLRGLKNLHVAKATSNPSSIYALTRILLVPSLMEPAGRVAVEAQLNRIPVLASDRGGWPGNRRLGWVCSTDFRRCPEIRGLSRSGELVGPDREITQGRSLLRRVEPCSL